MRVVVEEEIMQVEVVMLEVHHLILMVEERVVVEPVDLVQGLQLERLVLSILGETAPLPVQVVEEDTMEEQALMEIEMAAAEAHLILHLF